MENKAVLHGAFYECLKLIRTEKEVLMKSFCTMPNGNSLNNELLQEVPRHIEQTEEFNRLVQVAAELADSEHVREPISMFLKQCGAYHYEDDLSVFTDKHVEKLLSDLKESKSCRVQYLLSLPWVNTDNLQLPIDLGWFSMVRFSYEELENVLNNTARETFFPWASLATEDLLLLSKEAWLVVKDGEDIDFGGLMIDFSSLMGSVLYTHLPSKIEMALGSIMLLDWFTGVSKSKSIWWAGFHLGTRIKLSDSYFTRPTPPQKGVMAYEFVDEGVIDYTCFQYGCSELERLGEVVSILETLNKSEEHAIIPEHILRYLVKGAIRETDGPGKVDQFIDHVLCIEALLGDGRPGSTTRIGQRLGVLCDTTRKEEVAKYFRNEIYSLRSALVHGGQKSIMAEKLSWDVRELARKALLRTIYILHYYLQNGYSLSLDDFRKLLDLFYMDREAEDLREIVKEWPSQYLSR